MQEDQQTITAYTTHEDVLDALEDIARRHGLAHRLESGRVMLAAFYDGDHRAYQSRDRTKEARFTTFLAQHADQLQAYGWSETTARDAVRGWIVFSQLPTDLRASLFYSHIIELTRLHDGVLRQELAQECIQRNANVRALRLAVQRATEGAAGDERWQDAAEASPSQPPPQAGRLPARVTRWLSEVDSWTAAWRARPSKSLTAASRRELASSLSALEARVAELRKTLDPDR